MQKILSVKQHIRNNLEAGQGIFRLMPNFVPRRFNKAGHRLRLHPDDYYALGTHRGSIKERWFSSVIPAMNGKDTVSDEGMSWVLPFSEDTGQKFLLKDAADELKENLIGKELQEKYQGWPMYSKFFDYQAPLFHHLHLNFEKAARIGRLGKPEAYYFPAQLNNHMGEFPVTYFGFDPDTTKDQVKERLLKFEQGDNRITELSRAYRIELGTGWYTPPGVVHAPGSCLTYEPQWNSDVNSVYENISSSEIYPVEFLTENCPPDHKQDIDYVMDLMDWEKNIDPHYRKKYFRPPVSCLNGNESYIEKWIIYANEYIGAKELTVYPGQTIVSRDEAAYGCIIIQGHGQFGVFQAQTAVSLRFGQPSADEYFVSEDAAKKGVVISNQNKFEPMVILKHFANNHPEMPRNIS